MVNAHCTLLILYSECFEPCVGHFVGRQCWNRPKVICFEQGREENICVCVFSRLLHEILLKHTRTHNCSHICEKQVRSHPRQVKP